MLKYKVYTLGCKVSQAEGHQLRILLHRFNFTEALPDETPDICIVNTCAVTSVAAGKSRRLIRKLTRIYPKSKILLLGCFATFADQNFLSSIPQIIFCADHRQGILSAVNNFLVNYIAGKEKTSEPKNSVNNSSTNFFSNNNIKHSFGQKVKDKFSFHRHRALLKVQDGCDANCSYCVIPFLRPKLSSLPMEEAVEQAKSFIEAGHKEIILCGIFLGAYGKTTAKKSRYRKEEQRLVELIKNLIDLRGLVRLRLSSLEPLDLTEELLEIIASSDKIANHLHLPLQSGSDRILQKMGRQYRSKEYIETVERVRKRISDIAITSDVIVGFPFETDDDFQKTIDVCKQAEFSKIHIFPFSPRENTLAYNWRKYCASADVVRGRIEKLRAVEGELKNKFYERFFNKTVRVLIERVKQISDHRWQCIGKADQYFNVQVFAEKSLDNRVCSAKITDIKVQPISAEIEQIIEM